MPSAISEAQISNLYSSSLESPFPGGGTLLIESFKYPAELYANYFIERSTPARLDTIPYTGTSRFGNFDFMATFATRQFDKFSAGMFFVVGRDENFFALRPVAPGERCCTGRIVCANSRRRRSWARETRSKWLTGRITTFPFKMCFASTPAIEMKRSGCLQSHNCRTRGKHG